MIMSASVIARRGTPTHDVTGGVGLAPFGSWLSRVKANQPSVPSLIRQGWVRLHGISDPHDIVFARAAELGQGHTLTMQVSPGLVSGELFGI